jgi:hypothetical protein
MQLQEAIAKAFGDVLCIAGVEVVYTPAESGIEPFTISAIFGETRFDQLDHHLIRDLCECRIRHVDLAAFGVLTPTVRSQKSQGDLITGTDPNGSPISWAVVDLVHQHGLWVLTLERDVRIVA